jgi:hypothetical protein
VDQEYSFVERVQIYEDRIKEACDCFSKRHESKLEATLSHSITKKTGTYLLGLATVGLALSTVYAINNQDLYLAAQGGVGTLLSGASVFKLSS